MQFWNPIMLKEIAEITLFCHSDTSGHILGMCHLLNASFLIVFRCQAFLLGPFPFFSLGLWQTKPNLSVFHVSLTLYTYCVHIKGTQSSNLSRNEKSWVGWGSTSLGCQVWYQMPGFISSKTWAATDQSITPLNLNPPPRKISSLGPCRSRHLTSCSHFTSLSSSQNFVDSTTHPLTRTSQSPIFLIQPENHREDPGGEPFTSLPQGLSTPSQLPAFVTSLPIQLELCFVLQIPHFLL